MKATDFDQKIEALEADIAALKRARAVMYGDLPSILNGMAAKSAMAVGAKFWLKAGSAPALAQKALAEARKPLHCTEIVAAVLAMPKGKHFPPAYIKQALYVSA